MKELIDKSAVIAEIRNLQDSTMDECGNFYTAKAQAEYNILCILEIFLDALEAKEVQEEPVSEDLEEASRNYADNEEYGDDVYFTIKAAFKKGAKWQEEYILGDDNKQYHRLRHETLKRLYENEAKLELMLDNALEGYIEKYEQIGGHNYLSLKIPMLSKPDNCKDGDKIKLIILKGE